MIAPDLAGIPDFLTGLHRWVGWQNKDRGGKQTKVPKTARGTAAASTRADTWGQFEPIAIAFKREPEQFDGVGIVLGELGDEHLCGIDLDSCVNEDGALADWAKPPVAEVLTYAEVSPSGGGLKLFFRCGADDARQVRPAFSFADGTWGCKRSVGSNGADHGPAVEVYIGPGRYLTVTGKPWAQSPDAVALLDRPALLRLAELVPKPKAAVNGSAGADNTRSATALRKCSALRRAGKTFDEMAAHLRSDPETAEWVREKGEASGGRELKRIWARTAAKSSDPALTEDGIATAFAERHRNALQSCHHTGWHVWTGNRWKREETKLAFAWARDLCRELKHLAQGTATAAEYNAMAKAATYGAVETIAKADRAFAVTADLWDRDPFLLATSAATVDLQTIATRPANQRDRITMQTAVAPAEIPDCPKWLHFLEEATRGDAQLIRFLRQWAGYCLTGSTREHALLVIHGPGGNGKSVFADTIKSVLGDYARTAAMDTFTAPRGERHPTDLAMLRGARLVICNEIEEGREWNEARIKALTGGGMISARFMRKDFFEFEPEFKLMVVANHMPRLRHVDDAMLRRVLVAAFTFKPEVVNPKLKEELHEEWPAILRWMIEGCLDWQQHGLIRPPSVLAATATYFEQQDRFRAWSGECLVLHPTLEIRPSMLLASFNAWAERNGEWPTTRHELKPWILDQPGVRYVELHGNSTVKGIGLTGFGTALGSYP